MGVAKIGREVERPQPIVMVWPLTRKPRGGKEACYHKINIQENQKKK